MHVYLLDYPWKLYIACLKQGVVNNPYILLEKLLETELIRECLDVMWRIDENPPVYERRIAKSGFKKAIGVLKSPVTIKSIFKELAGNRSSPLAFSEEK